MSEFMNKYFTDSHDGNATLGRNYHEDSEPRERRAVYLSIRGASATFDLSTAKEIHEHLGAVIADIEAALEAQKPKNSDIIKDLNPGRVFTVKHDGKSSTTYFRTIVGYVSQNGLSYQLSNASLFNTSGYTVEV